MNTVLSAVLHSQETSMPRYASRLAALATGQKPQALFLTCADSRIVPNVLLTMDPGDLFVIRNVGNLIPPADHNGFSTGDVSEASAVAYAIGELGVREIVVCGHSNCGAMRAALMPGRPEEPNLAAWLSLTDSLTDRLALHGQHDPSLAAHDQLSQWNVVQQLEHLMTYPAVRREVERGALELHGMWFDIARARVRIYSNDAQGFVAVEDRLARAPAA